MLSKRVWIFSFAILLLLGIVGAQRLQAGSATVGSVAASRNATVDGHAVVPNTTLFSGDNLEVSDGTAVVSLKGGARLTMTKDTAASFLREANDVTVTLGHGRVALFHPNNKAAMKVKVAHLLITPAAGFKTVGEVAMLNGAVVVTAKEGRLRVAGAGPVMEVNNGEAFRFALPRPAQGAPGGVPAVGNAWSGAATAVTVIAGGAAAATVIYLVARDDESPSSP